MRIVFLYPIRKDALDLLSERLPSDIEIVAKIRGEDYDNVPPNQDPEIISKCKEAEILMGPYVTDEILASAVTEAGGKLKLVFIPWTGVDRIDFDLIKKYNVKVANSHGNARTIAEFAVALMLTGAKNIIHHDQMMRKGDWSSRFAKMPSLIIKGKTVGLLGYGAIGVECAKLLQGFDVPLIAIRSNPEKTSAEDMKLVQKIYSNEDLQRFLNESDVIINSLPLTPNTIDYLNEKEFQQMKDSVVIVNVGRGKTINEKALYDALISGKVFAAGIDPQWNYPARTPVPRQRDDSTPDEKFFPSEYPFQDLDNIVLSPHRAGHVLQGYERAHYDDVIENIIRVFEGKEPINLVDIEKGY
jgi:phosphoglycerate dehydrogenase-like enzyme